MLHIVLHIIVPLIIAVSFYSTRWKWVFLMLLCTMIVDIDHLLAQPVYDPNRCSINFHPLHTAEAILLYILLFLNPVFLKSKKAENKSPNKTFDTLHLAGLGLIVHMGLDWLDCLI